MGLFNRKPPASPTISDLEASFQSATMEIGLDPSWVGRPAALAASRQIASALERAIDLDGAEAVGPVVHGAESGLYATFGGRSIDGDIQLERAWSNFLQSVLAQSRWKGSVS